MELQYVKQFVQFSFHAEPAIKQDTALLFKSYYFTDNIEFFFPLCIYLCFIYLTKF